MTAPPATHVTDPARNAELEALLEVSQAMSASFELERNLAAALTALAEHLGMRRATVTLLDPDSGDLRIVVAHGLKPGEIARGTYRVGEGVVGRVMETRRPMVVPSIGKEPRFLNRTRSRLDREDVAFLCVPITLDGRAIGVLSADRVFAEGATFDQDIRVLRIVASMFAHSVDLYWAYLAEKRQTEALSAELRRSHGFPNIVGDSEAMAKVFHLVDKVAASSATVILRGESGTGKELIAKAIHYEGPRAKRPLVTVNCAALPENLLEAELFGYEKGAFTGAVMAKKGRFELADTGTIFLDEIGDLSPALQAKLLRVLQEQTFERLGGTRTIRVDVRVISATNRDLETMTRDGTFREDLYWRLNVVPIFLPPLRERREDVLPLIEHFLRRFNAEQGKSVRLAREAIKGLLSYTWPGNIRELENMVQRLVVLNDGGPATAQDLPLQILMDVRGPDDDSLTGELDGIERKRVATALADAGFVQARAARALGLTPRQFAYRMKKHGIPPSAV
jgi:Nif-specific regulatory protein